MCILEAQMMNWFSAHLLTPVAHPGPGPGAIFGLLSTAGSFLLFAQMVMLRRWSERKPEVVRAPRASISVLRPLAGRDDETEQLLLDAVAGLGPDDELLLGTASESDPAAAIADRVAAAHPGRVRHIRTERDAAMNPKVAQLIGLASAARGEIFVVSDSNVRIPLGYLDDIAAHLDDPEVGLCTHAVCGEGARTLGAWLDNLHLGSGIGGGVVAAKLLSGQDIVVGKSMAMRRTVLQRLGGWRAFADVLAEDYVLGRRVSEELGLRVAISRLVVRQVSATRTTRAYLDRFGRWGTMQRFAVGLPVYLAQGLLTPVVLAAVGVFVEPSYAGLAVFGIAWMARIAGDVVSLRLLGAPLPPLWSLPLLPLREATTCYCWARGLVVRHVNWRGNQLRVTHGTRLVADQPPSLVPAPTPQR